MNKGYFKGDVIGLFEMSLSQVYNMNDWWKERQIIVRRMIKNRDYKTAYRLVADHGSLEGQEYAEAEWLAGWLALRFLNDPARGLVHFQNMQPRMKTAISKARASYWTARSLEQGGRSEDATKWYQYAMQFPKVYYGQLAAGRLKQNAPDPVAVTASAQDRARPCAARRVAAASSVESTPKEIPSKRASATAKQV